MREMNLDFDDLFELKRADIAGQSDYMHEEKLAAVDKFEKLYHENLESGNCTDKKQLAVNGGDLIKAGVDKGPEMGRLQTQRRLCFQEQRNIRSSQKKVNCF